MKNLIAYATITFGVLLVVLGWFAKFTDFTPYFLAFGIVMIGVGGGMRTKPK
ncbi:hypothetical protein [Aliiroseovarius sp.]|uniref:hypothetical protein n=1 Tax=Aliiroseovarius sp. TaxID=1872442 RepID=UPI003BAD46CC